MKISVLMAVYNAQDTVLKAIDSILNQTIKDFEFIIVDDRSTDHTRDVIRGIQDSRIRLYLNESNIGQTKSLNIGLMHCSGKYIARMDADDYSLHYRFEKQLAAFDKDPNLAVVGTRATKLIKNKLINDTFFPYNYEALRFHSMYKNPLNHVSTIIRKDIMVKFGGYDESFLIAADFDLWSRLLRMGYRIKVISDRCIIYNVSETSYRKKNVTVSESEVKDIIKKNKYFFTNRTVDDSFIDFVLQIHSFTPSNPKKFFFQLKLWLKVALSYSYISKSDYVLAFSYDLIIIFLKYLRSVLRFLFQKWKC